MSISSGPVDFYITVGLYNDGRPGELFIKVGRHGDTVKGLVNNWVTAVSICLQAGVPLRVLTSKGVHQRFQPAGMTANPEIRVAKSIVDYIYRWLELTFPSDSPV